MIKIPELKFFGPESCDSIDEYLDISQYNLSCFLQNTKGEFLIKQDLLIIKPYKLPNLVLADASILFSGNYDLTLLPDLLYARKIVINTDYYGLEDKFDFANIKICDELIINNNNRLINVEYIGYNHKTSTFNYKINDKLIELTKIPSLSLKKLSRSNDY